MRVQTRSLDRDAEERRILAGVVFSAYAPEGLTVELDAWSGGDGEPVSSVRLTHESETGEGPMVSVDSEFDADGDTPEDDYARLAAEHFEGQVVSGFKGAAGRRCAAAVRVRVGGG